MSQSQATLVVIEYGGTWPRWLKPSAPGLSHVAVVAQHYEGHPSSLLTQVASRLSRLERAGWDVQRVIFASNGRCDSASGTSRLVLIRGLASRLIRARRGSLLLTCEADASLRARQQLQDLVETLSPEALAGRVKLRYEPPGESTTVRQAPGASESAA